MSNSKETLSSPKGGAFAITPSDDTDLTIGATAIYVGGAGNVKLITSLGQTVTFVGVSAGQILPVRAKRVIATLTTATNLVGLY